MYKYFISGEEGILQKSNLSRLGPEVDQEGGDVSACSVVRRDFSRFNRGVVVRWL